MDVTKNVFVILFWSYVSVLASCQLSLVTIGRHGNVYVFLLVLAASFPPTLTVMSNGSTAMYITKHSIMVFHNPSWWYRIEYFGNCAAIDCLDYFVTCIINIALGQFWVNSYCNDCNYYIIFAVDISPFSPMGKLLWYALLSSCIYWVVASFVTFKLFLTLGYLNESGEDVSNLNSIFIRTFIEKEEEEWKEWEEETEGKALQLMLVLFVLVIILFSNICYESWW